MVNNPFLKIWIRSFLKRIGRKNPNFTEALIDSMAINTKEKLIMKLRYINGLSWDKIADYKGVYLSKIRVLQIDKECIESLEYLVF